MADANCGSCGQGVSYSDQFCARCGASAFPVAADPDATSTGAYSPYRPLDPPPPADPWATRAPSPYPYGADQSYSVPPYSDQPYGGQPGPPTRPSGQPPRTRRPVSPAVMIAVAALAVAIIAVTVTVIVATSGTSGTPVAAGSSAGGSTSASATPSASGSAPGSPSGGPTYTPTQVITVTRSATLTAGNQPGGAAADPVPESTSQLRSYYEAGTLVDPTPYEGASGNLLLASPSRNIECFLVVDEGVQCAINRYDFPQPGPDCDNGAIVSIDDSGSATYSGCLSAPIGSAGRVLAYGASVTQGGFGCVSKSAGLSCVDLDTDTGFTLSRESFIPVN